MELFGLTVEFLTFRSARSLAWITLFTLTFSLALMLKKRYRVKRILFRSLITYPGSEAKHASFSYNVIRKLLLPLLNSFTCNWNTSSRVRNSTFFVHLVNIIRIHREVLNRSLCVPVYEYILCINIRTNY